jgi:predicted porin
MKKTIIAASVAAFVAAPAAFADVKIGGNVVQEFVSDNASGYSDHGIDSEAAVDLVFSVSEDLGNGMSAFAKIHQLSDDGSGSQAPADQSVGIKGDFGTIVAGRMESFTEGKVSAMAANDASDTLSIETNRGFATARADGALAYVSPSFNGFTFGVAGFAMNNTGSAASTTTTTISMGDSNINVSGTDVGALSLSGATDNVSIISAADSTLNVLTSNAANVTNQNSNFDAIDVMVEYANGPLLVRVSREVTDASTFNVSSAKDQTITNMGINYTIGDTTLTGTMYDVANGDGQDSNDVDGYFVGVKHKMGANTLAWSYMEEDTLSDGDKGTGQDKSWIVSVDHALSKRTSLTADYKDHDDVTASSDFKSFAVGIKHVF